MPRLFPDDSTAYDGPTIPGSELSRADVWRSGPRRYAANYARRAASACAATPRQSSPDDDMRAKLEEIADELDARRMAALADLARRT